MQKKLNEDFIEKYSEHFASKISDDFFSSNSHISGQEILSISPSKQVNFFVIKLLFNNWQQESQRLESPFFNYSSPEVKEALLQFMNTLSRFIRVERKEFEILLQDAIRDTLFLLMSPNVYMEIELDRKGAEELTDKTVKSILKYIRIAKNDLADYLNSNIGTDRDDIDIDEDIITEDIISAELELLNSVIPITLTKLQDGDEDDAVDDLLNVSEDDLISPTVARSSAPEIKQDVNVDEVDSSDDPEETIQEEEEIEETPTPAVSTTTPVEEERSEPELEEEKEEEETVVFEEDDASEEELTEKPPVKEEPAEGVITNMAPGEEEEDEDEDILNDKFEDPLNAPTIVESHAEQVDNMMSAISVNHRYMFINELFDGEADVFTAAISKIEQCSSFDDSVEILVQNYAKDYHWDMNSDEVKELLKIIFRRFR